jgi:hypothetical protein
MIRDDGNNQYAHRGEALCRLAGAMLLRSPIRLSQKVKSRSDYVSRWLYFLAEKQGLLMQRTHGDLTIGQRKMKDSFLEEGEGIGGNRRQSGN